MNKKATIVGTLSTLFTLSAILLNTPYLNPAFAQEGPPGEAGVTDEPLSPDTPFNQTGPETATELEEYAGSDDAILANDTDISNPNNTMLDADDVNIREDCMQVPGNTAEDCP
ncbi:MAG: hypothetical protein QOK66_07585 [Nitrososphaeraceae archaeon]|nr:hypothetical protein [Nitrososphaeraceae archaeon]